jgi:hypothetical protein
MNRFALLLLVSSASLLSCRHHPSTITEADSVYFEFGYNDVFHSCFSLYYTGDDTIHIQQYFARRDNSKWKSNTSYYALLSSAERIELLDSLQHFDFRVYDSSYNQGYEDGLTYAFYIDNPPIRKMIYVHSDSAPAKLKTLMQYLYDVKERLQPTATQQVHALKTARYFKLPPVKLDSVKFVPPQNGTAFH